MFSASFAPFAHLIPSLADVLVASLWQGLALVLFTACAFRLLPAQSAALRSALWVGVLVLAASLPLLLWLPGTPGTAGHRAIWHPRATLSGLLIAVWLLAAAVRLAQLAASAAHLRRVLRRAEPLVRSPALDAVLRDGRRQVRVCTSRDVSRPSVAGFLRPCILLPPGLLAGASDAELQQILVHECEHLRRHDHWINLISQISLLLFPLSPALLWVNRRLALERELACDDRVLQVTGARKAYAACLARVAESSLAQRGLALAVGILGARRHNPDLARRVERILAPPVPTASRFGSRFAAGALCAGLLGGTVLLARSPELVSFAPVQGRTMMAAEAPAAIRPYPMVEQVVPVVDRVSRVSRMPRVRMVSAILPQRPSSRTHRRPPFRYLSLGAASVRAPMPMLTGWHGSSTAPLPTDAARASTKTSAATLRVVPVVLRVSSPDPGSDPGWYTAFQTPEGWVVVMI